MDWEIFGIVLIGLYALVGISFRRRESIPYFQNEKTHDERLDQIRGIAMIGIVCIHIHSYFEFYHPGKITLNFFTLLLANLSRFSVPVFILGSSMYLKKKPGYWPTKVHSLLIPYTIASIIGYSIKYSEYSIIDFTYKFLTGQVFTPFYFVPLLFQFYLLFYFLPDRMQKGYGLLLLFGLSFVINFSSNLGFFENLLPKWYQPISIFNYLLFFALGIVIKNSKNQVTTKTNVELTSLVTLFLLAVVMLSFESWQGINLKNHHLVYPFAVFLILNLILPGEPKNFFYHSLRFLGRKSLFIFLLHPFVIHLMHIFDPLYLGPPVFAYILTLALNLAIPSLMAYLITFRKGNP